MDGDGRPADPEEREAVVRATCTQTGQVRRCLRRQTVKIGSVQLDRAGTGNAGPPRYAQNAVSILRKAGLLLGYVIDGPYC